MPKVALQIPQTLRPYQFHGAELRYRENEANVYGDCLICGRADKFSVEVATGRWRCLKCGASGNAITFIRQLWEMCSADAVPLSHLVAERKLLSSEVLKLWGVRISPLGVPLVPGYQINGEIGTLYRYAQGPGDKKAILRATSGLHTYPYGVNEYDSDKPILYICEGPWDGVALLEVLKRVKYGGDGELLLTSDVTHSLAARANVIAIPGCSSFSANWLQLVAGKQVVLLFDNDHPKTDPNGKQLLGAGYLGMRRTAKILLGAKPELRPAGIEYLSWGEGGHDPSLSDGYDVRDLLTANGLRLRDRIAGLQTLLGKIHPVPDEWKGESSEGKGGSDDLTCLSCRDWRELTQAWRRALKWTEGLERALATMLASVVSTTLLGDQLWVKIVAPPSTGKSTLCEALSVNKEYVIAKSTLRGFHSGWGDGGEDHSLITAIAGKTLVIKDADTLLQSPNLGQILSEARDLYDTTSRSSYRKKSVSRDHEGIRMTMILCGTSSLRRLDSSELGERFLDCVIMDGIDDELEEEILMRVASRADRNVTREANGQLQSQYDPDLATAMRLTGGYIDYLRKSASELLAQVEMDEESKRRIILLGKFVAYMRGRPSTSQEESAEREFAARLVSQLVRLAKCMAAVLGKKAVSDPLVMRRVRAVALDTARGRTLQLTKLLYEAGEGGMQLRQLASKTGHSEEKERVLMRFLSQIGAVKSFQPVATNKRGEEIKLPKAWKLTDRMRELYREVVADAEATRD